MLVHGNSTTNTHTLSMPYHVCVIVIGDVCVRERFLATFIQMEINSGLG